jgi:hypothetical protein
MTRDHREWRKTILKVRSTTNYSASKKEEEKEGKKEEEEGM